MTDEEPKQRPHGCLLVLLGWGVFIGSYIVSEMSRWTDKSRGIECGVFHAAPYSLFFAVIVLPVMAVILFFVRRKWVRPLWRALIVTSPALVLACLLVGSAIISPLDSKKRFAGMMDHQLPAGADGFKAYHSGGGFVDYLDMYYFRASSNEIQELIGSRPYKLRERDMIGALPVGGLQPPTDWPQPRDWKGLRVYEFDKDAWFYYIMTDEAQTQVYAIAGCI